MKFSAIRHLLSPDAPAAGPAGGDPVVSPAAPVAPAAPKAPEGGDKGGAKEPDMTGIKALAAAYLGEKPPQAPAKPNDPPKPPAKPKAQAKPKAPAKPAAQPVPLTPEAIAAAAAEGVARALPKPEAPAKKTETPAGEELDAKEKRRVQVLDRLEKLYPDQYKGVSKKYADGQKALRKYAKDWESGHPGQEFDETAEEHEQFMAQHDVNWDDEHYTEALADLRAEARQQEVANETKSKLSEIERREKVREAAPIIDREQTGAARRFWKDLGDDYAGLITDNGSVDQAKLVELQQKDPVFAMRLQNAQALDFEVSELYKVMNGLEPFMEKPPVEGDPQYEAKLNQYRAHQVLGDFAQKQEDAMLAQPAEDQLDSKGRQFLPAAKYWDRKLSKADREANYWTFTHTDLATIRAAQRAAATKQAIEQEEKKFEAWAKSRGISLEAKPAGERQDEPPVEEETPGGDDVKPLSPTSVPTPKVAASKGKAASGNESPLETFIKRGF